MIDERNRDQTVFTWHHGLVRFVGIPFQLKKVFETFQRAEEVTLASVRWYFTLEYVEDVFVFLKSSVEHIKQVWHTLRVFYKTGVALKIEKYIKVAELADYLDDVIQHARVELVEGTRNTMAKPSNSTIQMEQ